MPDAPDPIGPLYSQAQLAKMLDPTGEVGITARSIRTEIEAGRLKAVKFAGKLCIRHEDALERLGGVKCQSETRDRGSSWPRGLNCEQAAGGPGRGHASRRSRWCTLRRDCS